MNFSLVIILKSRKEIRQAQLQLCQLAQLDLISVNAATHPPTQESLFISFISLNKHTQLLSAESNSQQLFLVWHSSAPDFFSNFKFSSNSSRILPNLNFSFNYNLVESFRVPTDPACLFQKLHLHLQVSLKKFTSKLKLT